MLGLECAGERADMRAVVLDGDLRFVRDYPAPEVPPGWARVRVRMAGICGTDMELIEGYKEFKGVLGHEFVGVVDQCENAEWVDKRVVGEINAGCGHCEWCKKGMGRHCPERRVLGTGSGRMHGRLLHASHTESPRGSVRLARCPGRLHRAFISRV